MLIGILLVLIVIFSVEPIMMILQAPRFQPYGDTTQWESGEYQNMKSHALQLYRSYLSGTTEDQRAKYYRWTIFELQEKGVPKEILFDIDQEAVCAMVCVIKGLANPLDFSTKFRQTWYALVVWARNNGYPDAF